MRYASYLLAGTVAAGFGLFSAMPEAQAFPTGLCLAIGASNTDCGATIVINPGGSLTIEATGQPPYDSVEDTTVGVLNSSGATVTSIHLTQGGPGTPIFGFDGDGICDFSGGDPLFCEPTDPTGYGGPGVTFSGIAADLLSGDVNFINGLADGASLFFSLEGPPSSIAPPAVPEPATLAILGLGLAGLALARRRR